LPESLIESQLFGPDKGAFTGATGARAGLFEAADGGTIFLDELGELSPAAQAKLLRVLETRRVVRLGEVRERAVDVRVVAATNRDLGAESAAGRFRDDLYFRLAAARVVLPPLRDRPRELSRLARHFLDEACRRAGRTPLALSAATIYALRAHRWPGNVRELRHVMDYLAATAADDVEVEPWQLPDGIGHPAPAPPVVPAPAAPSAPTSRGSAAGGGFRPIDEELRELECQRMREALAAAEGVQTRAAELIGMPLRTFVTKSKQYGLRGGARRGRTS
jgi:transcriptional regulator with GAF, ATPase, and Fis domain